MFKILPQQMSLKIFREAIPSAMFPLIPVYTSRVLAAANYFNWIKTFLILYIVSTTRNTWAKFNEIKK